MSSQGRTEPGKEEGWRTLCSTQAGLAGLPRRVKLGWIVRGFTCLIIMVGGLNHDGTDSTQAGLAGQPGRAVPLADGEHQGLCYFPDRRGREDSDVEHGGRARHRV